MESTVLPMFPLEMTLLPDDDLPLRIFEPRYSQLVADCLAADDPVFGVVLIAAGREVGGGDNRYDVGVAGPHRRASSPRRWEIHAAVPGFRTPSGAALVT